MEPNIRHQKRPIGLLWPTNEPANGDVMSKGERTREQVIEKAAALFNRVGYQATSISDVMHATGLQKGGIYRHFDSKEALGLAAFDYAVEEMRRRFDTALQGKTHAQKRLEAIF